jgi:4-amino-4-deoxy-L-arabinose transferase-like glycosyltransferase
VGQGLLTRAPAVVLIVLLFCAGLVSLAHDYYFSHVDEHRYADAAIHKVQSGDWITPNDSGGYPRFQKPILTYGDPGCCLISAVRC